jgi:membrane protease YdiL (CAAX protease family)
MKKLISLHKRRRKLESLIIASVLVLALLIISIETASSSSQEFSNSPEMRHAIEEKSTKTLEEAKHLRVSSISYENLEFVKKLGLHTNIPYTIEVIGVTVLALLIYPCMTLRKNRHTKNSLKTLYSLKIRKMDGNEEINHESFDLRKRRLFTVIPVLCIVLAEILMFLGKVGIAIWLHIGILIALSLSNTFVKDSEVQKIYQALMLLPILRLITLSMPVFFETTLYTFIFVYGCLAIPVAVIIIHQNNTLEQIGISMKNIGIYMILSIPLSFILGLGEYMTIRAEYLIPDLTFEDLFKLIFVMVFFVGLIEELIFRSILQTELEQGLSISESLLITSLLFGFMLLGY